MSRPGRPGHDFHFPRGASVLSESGAKTLMISMGHFFARTASPVRLCPGTKFDYFDCFGYCIYRPNH